MFRALQNNLGYDFHISTYRKIFLGICYFPIHYYGESCIIQVSPNQHLPLFTLLKVSIRCLYDLYRTIEELHWHNVLYTTCTTQVHAVTCDSRGSIDDLYLTAKYTTLDFEKKKKLNN